MQVIIENSLESEEEKYTVAQPCHLQCDNNNVLKNKLS